MVVRKFREKRNWSQEQLATMTGLSTRTIQRIESGNKASLESLKALAAVFEVDISRLTEEIIVIDKDSASWKSQPRWLQAAMLGVSKRRPLAQVEFVCLGFGLVTWVIHPHIFTTPALFLFAYLISKLIARIDQDKLW